MFSFSCLTIGYAAEGDMPAIIALINSAYRGESSRQGWTTEANLIAGNTRVNYQILQQTMKRPGSVILVFINNDRQITGCVNLQAHADKLYLGMLSVSPSLQGAVLEKNYCRLQRSMAATWQKRLFICRLSVCVANLSTGMNATAM